jgi:hypothetical protein
MYVITNRFRNVVQGIATRAEEGQNTSTVALEVVRGDEKGTQCPEV